MTDADFDAVQWKNGMKVTILPEREQRSVVGVNFEYRVVLLSDHRNRQEWYFFYQVEIV